MPAEVISGKDMAVSICEEVKQRVAGLKESGLTPGLARSAPGRRPGEPGVCQLKEQGRDRGRHLLPADHAAGRHFGRRAPGGRVRPQRGSRHPRHLGPIPTSGSDRRSQRALGHRSREGRRRLPPGQRGPARDRGPRRAGALHALRCDPDASAQWERPGGQARGRGRAQQHRRAADGRPPAP